MFGGTVDFALMDVNDGIGSELDAHLHEHAEIVDLPFDGLRQGRNSDDVVLKMGEPVGLHMPVASADAEAHCLGHAIRDESFELKSPSLAVLGNGAGETTDEIADSQPVRVGTVEPDRRKPSGLGTEPE